MEITRVEEAKNSTVQLACKYSLRPTPTIYKHWKNANAQSALDLCH